MFLVESIVVCLLIQSRLCVLPVGFYDAIINGIALL